MTNRERVRHVLDRSLGPLCDDCLGREAGLVRRQVAYQEVEAMGRTGEVERGTGECLKCHAHKRVTFVKRHADPPLRHEGWTAWEIPHNGQRFVLVAREEDGQWVGTVSAPPPLASDPGPGLIRAMYVTGQDIFALMAQALSSVDYLAGPQ
jgi:hypothetical protein